MNETDKFKRELLLRKYAQNSIDTYVSLLGVLIDRTKLDMLNVKDYLCTVTLMIENWNSCNNPHFVKAESQLKLNLQNK